MGKIDIVGGASFGALVGFLLGFSTQSVIGGAIAAVLALVTGFIGISKPVAFQAAPGDNGQAIRMVAFGSTAAVCFLLAYYLAVNHILEPSPLDIKTSLIEAGFKEDDAKVMIGAKYFGIAPEGWKKYSN